MYEVTWELRPGTRVHSLRNDAPDYRKVGIVVRFIPGATAGDDEYDVRWLYPDTCRPGDKELFVPRYEILPLHSER